MKNQRQNSEYPRKYRPVLQPIAKRHLMRALGVVCLRYGALNLNYPVPQFTRSLDMVLW
jgi:hypothetical protein